MYATKYSIPFKNREQTDCEVKLLLNDFVGDITTLQGAENPYILSRQSQDNQLPYGILGTEAVIEFYTGGIVTLNDFYSEDPTDWKVEFYYGGVLRFTHYLQIDNSSEALTDTDHVLSLNANDGLGQLQDLYLLEADGTPLYRNWLLTELLSYIFAFIPFLDIDVYLNIFENSTEDRDDFNYLTLLPQTAINTRYYINDDGTTQSLYDILNNILLDFRCALFQEKGVWNIVRWGDLRIFDPGAIPGTRYSGFTGAFEEVFYPDEINIGRGLVVHPINENQLKRPLRALKYSKETFNYNQPATITQANLQIPSDAVPFATITIGDFRYDDYELAVYFPSWLQRNGDDSFLRIVTDVSIDPEVEVERYIVTPATNTANKGIQLPAIAVSKDDNLTFSFQYKTEVNEPDAVNFYFRIIVLAEDSSGYDKAGGTDWVAFAAGDYDIQPYLHVFIPGGDDSSQYSQITISGTLPISGMLIIQMNGSNTDISLGAYQTTVWNDMNLTFIQYINLSTQIIGQTHTNTQTPEVRLNEQYDVFHDDSPRNTITGTLFTDAVTTFDADIGGVYFTKTKSWHRQGIEESRRLGDLNTFNDLFIQVISREIVEGDFFGLTDVSMLPIVNFDFAPTKKFIFGIASFNFMSCIWNATLYEIFYEDEPDVIINLIEILNTNADLTTYSSTGELFAISFSDIILNTEFTPDGGFINFTYDGINATIDIEVNIEGIWDSTASATLNLNKNGVSIGSFFVGIGGAFHPFTANIMASEALTSGDQLSITMNWSGAVPYSLEVLSDSYLKATREEFVTVGAYLFNYIYK